jgi:hypothetical protein
MNPTTTVPLALAILVVLQALIAFGLSKTKPDSPLTTILDFLHGALPLAFGHMVPGAPMAVARAAKRAARASMMLFVLVFTLVACAALQTLVKDNAGAICEVVVQAEDPKLAPICTTFDELASVKAELTGAKVSPATSPTTDAPPPSRSAVYLALAARHAKAPK